MNKTFLPLSEGSGGVTVVEVAFDLKGKSAAKPSVADWRINFLLLFISFRSCMSVIIS